MNLMGSVYLLVAGSVYLLVAGSVYLLVGGAPTSRLSVAH
jgi:hypothetical protein